MNNRGKRNIDKVVRGSRRPGIKHDFAKEWVVKGKEVAGAPIASQPFYCEAQALRHAEWWQGHPGIVEIEVEGPKFDGPVVEPTEHDIAVGQSLVDLLEHVKVGPVQKYLIGRWMDSKAWGGSLDAAS